MPRTAERTNGQYLTSCTWDKSRAKGTQTAGMCPLTPTVETPSDASPLFVGGHGPLPASASAGKLGVELSGGVRGSGP